MINVTTTQTRVGELASTRCVYIPAELGRHHLGEVVVSPVAVGGVEHVLVLGAVERLEPPAGNGELGVPAAVVLLLQVDLERTLAIALGHQCVVVAQRLALADDDVGR